MKLRNLAKKIKKLIDANQFILYLVIFFIAFFVLLWIQTSPNLADPDSFYHLKMSKLIAESGPIMDFPWLQQTVLKDNYTDHHFLYHVAAIPFIKILGDFVGFKLFTALLSSFFILLVYWFFKKYKIKYAEFFALVLLFSGSLMFRLSLAKASAFSLILLFFGIYLIFKRKNWTLLALSFIYVWSYDGFPLILLMVLVFIIADSLYNSFLDIPLWLKLKKIIWPRKFLSSVWLFIKNIFNVPNIKTIAAVLGGIFLGIIINPYFPKNLIFYWQHIIEIGLVNYQKVLNVGGEWYPYDFYKLLTDTGAAVIVGVMAIFFFFIFIKKQSKESIFFFLTTLIFFGLTLQHQRHVEYFVPHLVFMSAFSLSYLFTKLKLREFIFKIKKDTKFLAWNIQLLIGVILILIIFIMINAAYTTKQSFSTGISFSKYEGVSQYLLANSQPGEVIMHTDWDEFPSLFYHNHQNYYIIGLDPTFMYNYDQQMYDLYAKITTGQKTDNLYDDIKDKFKASYFMIEHGREQLETNLLNDGNFIKVYEDDDAKLFKLK